MMRLGTFPPLTIALAAAAGAGLLALILVLAPSIVFAPHAAAGIRPLRAIALPPADARPFEDYAAIAAKPLFNPARQKDPLPPPEGEEKDVLPPLSDYRLVGIVIARESKLALVERRAAKQVVTLHTGDDLDGRRVDDIRPNGVVLSGGAAPELLAIPKADGKSR